MKEWRLLCKAKEYKDIDRMFWIHQQAFHNFRATSKKKAGKNKQAPVYSTFSKFFDYKKLLRKIENDGEENDEFAAIKEYLRRKEK